MSSDKSVACKGQMARMQTTKILRVLRYLFPGQSWDSRKLHQEVKRLDKPYFLMDGSNSYPLGTIKYFGQPGGRNSEHLWEMYAYPLLLQKFNEASARADSELVLQANVYPQLWYGIEIRSPGELAIAKALEKRGVLFFVNSSCRLRNRLGRSDTWKIDFLVFYKRLFRILEVDGVTYHQYPLEDYRRDRVFAREGIQTSRFTAQECMENADLVVEEFLDLF